ncbi:HEC/Ndc80p family-domain-containing protein [Sparassis latifolia]
MTDFGRRSAMQSVVEPNNGRSNIPLPSTIKKPTPHGRMSMAGPALRGPMPQVPGTNPRLSMMRSQNLNPLLQSASKPGFGRTPMHNARLLLMSCGRPESANSQSRAGCLLHLGCHCKMHECYHERHMRQLIFGLDSLTLINGVETSPFYSNTRRGSMWAGGAQIGPLPGGQGSAKDTRPLRDKQFQARMRQDIVTWLLSNGYDVPPQILQNVSNKDFRSVFERLVTLLDSSWPFELDRRLEEQFLQPLRALRYPYVGQIDLKWIVTPATPHSWPHLLGVLHWLAETGRNSSVVPEQFDDINHHEALAMDHYIASYAVFLEGKDAFPEQERILEERYAKKDGQVVAELDESKEQSMQVQNELEMLTESPAPIEKLKEDFARIKRDKAKFEEILRRCEHQKEKRIKFLERETAELANAVSSLEKLQAEKQRLADVVKVQNLTPEEVIRMNTEHETLSRDVETLKHKIAETNQAVVKLEVSLTRKVSDAEEALDLYNNLLSNLGLFPPLPPPLEEIDLTLDLNSAAANPQNLLSGPDIRVVVKPTLSKVAEIKRTERALVESERIKVDDELDQLTLECENMDEEVMEISNKVNGLSDQADELREVAQQEALVSNAEASRLERDLAQARTSAMANGVGVKSRMQALQIAYREQVDKVNRLKDETMRAIIKNSSDIFMFKEEVSKQLKHLRDVAEAN